MLRTLIVLAMLAGIGCDSGSSPSEETVDLGPSGGKFETAGLVIDVPQGAVDHQLTISVTIAGRSADGYAVHGLVYRFTPEGLHFANPISVSFPTGMLGESVFWSTEGDDSRFERLETTIEQGRATARVAHFSLAFVGVAKAPQADAEADGSRGVTCTVKRSVVPPKLEDPCTDDVTVEEDVKFWLTTHNNDPEGAITTNSSGIIRLYNFSQLAIFVAQDAAHTLYRGYTDGDADSNNFGIGYRSGTTLTFTMDGYRYGSGGCGVVPLIAVQCSGTTTLLPGPPPVVVPDAGGAPMDVSSDAGPPDASASDGATDAVVPPDDIVVLDATGGVTCTVKERDPSDPCKQVLTVEQDVGFWLDYVLTNPTDPDRENGLATNSHGILRYYNKTVPQQIFTATDATHTLYRGYVDSTSPWNYGTGQRSGNALTFTMNAERGAQTGPGCSSAIPLVAVECSGTTTLLPGPPP
ncbi:MAG TPA: hypothetical protein VK540_10080 [Polyangiaceae bacterium]|nr:hypothetical protein [Polyangiaceae bacterium]